MRAGLDSDSASQQFLRVKEECVLSRPRDLIPQPPHHPKPDAKAEREQELVPMERGPLTDLAMSIGLSVTGCRNSPASPEDFNPNHHRLKGLTA